MTKLGPQPNGPRRAGEIRPRFDQTVVMQIGNSEMSYARYSLYLVPAVTLLLSAARREWRRG